MKDNFATAKVHYLSKMTKKKQETDSKIKRLLRLPCLINYYVVQGKSGVGMIRDE